MEIDVASFDTETQVSGGPAPVLRDDLPRSPHAIRALGPPDEIAFRDLLLGLDEASRISRFSCVLGDDGIVRHARRALREAAWVAGLSVDGELCGLVELYETCEPGAVEAAFAVTKCWRRQGVGTALLFAAIEWARRSHHASLRMIFARGNWPMRRLAGKAEASLDLALDKLIASIAIGRRVDQCCRAGGDAFLK
jgi:GNAT superfamily N-acetyltransferase